MGSRFLPPIGLSCRSAVHHGRTTSHPHSHLGTGRGAKLLCLVTEKTSIGDLKVMEYAYAPPGVRRPSAPARLYGDCRLGEPDSGADSSTWAHASSAIAYLG